MRLRQSLPATVEYSPASLGAIDMPSLVTVIPTPFDDFYIKFAVTPNQLSAANQLVEKMYLSRGYEIEHIRNDTYKSKTLVVETGGEVVGTMAICMDGDKGLPADDNYRDKLDELRALGRKICEPSRLAIRRTLPHSVFASMMHASYMYSHKMHGCTDYLIEVNPRHATFYKKMLGFKDFGSLRTCTRVHAPAVLLRLECVFIDEQLNQPAFPDQTPAMN
jgi:hypothetical protein